MALTWTLPALVGALVLAAALAAYLAVVARGLRRRLERQERLVAALERDVRGLCAGARGMGDAIGRLDGRVRAVGERQDEAAQGGAVDLGAYRRAIGMVRKGAGVRELVEHIGLEPGEAELVHRLHHRESAPGRRQAH